MMIMMCFRSLALCPLSMDKSSLAGRPPSPPLPDLPDYVIKSSIGGGDDDKGVVGTVIPGDFLALPLLVVPLLMQASPTPS